MTTKQDQAQEVCDRLRELLRELWQEDRIDPQTILVAANAELSTVMAQVFGGQLAAVILESAAEKVQPLPSFAEAKLAAAAPAGTA